TKPQLQQSPLLPSTGPKSPVFRTGSEPVLSPSLQRRSAEPLAGPPVPPVKPQKFRHVPFADSHVPSSSAVSPPEVVQYPDSEVITGRIEQLQPSPADLRSCSPQGSEWEQPKSQNTPLCSYVERLKTDSEKEGQKTLDRSSYHHAIAALESTSEEEEEDSGKEEGGDIRRREKAGHVFLQPVMETESTFMPTEFETRLLPPENKPLEMVVLKRAKELLLSHNHQSIARHLLMADCQVARILGVTPQLKGQMGVSSGLELVTLPHGRQLRLDLMERYASQAAAPISMNVTALEMERSSCFYCRSLNEKNHKNICQICSHQMFC
ncbi:hypothetical protein XENOCAPTIV_006560, partial [Xenoophorus captivus]